MSTNVTSQLLRIHRNLLFAAKKIKNNNSINVDFKKYHITAENSIDHTYTMYNIEQLSKLIAYPDSSYLMKYEKDAPKKPLPRVTNYPMYD